MEINPSNQPKNSDSQDLGGTPLDFYWEEFKTHYLREGKSECTLRNVSDALKFVMRHLEIVTIEQANNPGMLREALHGARERRHWSGVTFNTYLKNLNTYFLWLADMDYIDENNLGKVRKCKPEQNEQPVLSENEVSLLLARLLERRQTKLERERNYFFVSFAVLTGARLCELLAMEVKDIRQVKGTYHIFIKGKKQKGRVRTYRMTSALRDSFERYMSIRAGLGRDERGLFVSLSKRTGWTEKGVRGLFKRLSNELGFKITAYSIRRFVATKLFLTGIPMQSLMNHLGHTRMTTTLRYVERSYLLTDDGVGVMARLLE